MLKLWHYNSCVWVLVKIVMNWCYSCFSKEQSTPYNWLRGGASNCCLVRGANRPKDDIHNRFQKIEVFSLTKKRNRGVYPNPGRSVLVCNVRGGNVCVPNKDVYLMHDQIKIFNKILKDLQVKLFKMSSIEAESKTSNKY